MIIIMIIIIAVYECVRSLVGVCCCRVDTKQLVMTGKEHRRPRAVFHIQVCANHFIPFFRKKKKRNRNYWCDLWGCCRTEMSKAGGLTGLFSTVENQHASFIGFKCFLVGVIRCKFPLFKPVKVRAKEI